MVTFLTGRPVHTSTIDFVKTSYASTVPLPSSSRFSKQGALDPYDVTSYSIFNTEKCNFPTYTVGELVRCRCEPYHHAIRDAMKKWVKANIGQRFSVQSECGLGCMESDQLFLSKRKIVDVLIKYGSLVSVQFEVESDSDRNATVIKLGYGLIDQHRYLMNRGVVFNNIIGFYIPVQPDQHVEKVTCTWSDDSLCYKIDALKLPREEVLSNIKTVNNSQSVYQLQQQSRSLKLPLNLSFISSKWGSDAYQAKSGASVVIVCPTDRAVYKNSLSRREASRLQELLDDSPNLTANLTCCAIPTARSGSYIKFPAYTQPMSREDAEKFIFPLVTDVIAALTELHEFGLAHLDVRLDNICFREDGSVIMIDLDRSTKVTEAANLLCVFGSSTMYPFKTNWTADNVDWRQLAIMILYILDRPAQPYHEITAGPSCHGFIHTMFAEGNV